MHMKKKEKDTSPKKRESAPSKKQTTRNGCQEDTSIVHWCEAGLSYTKGVWVNALTYSPSLFLSHHGSHLPLT